MAVFACAAPSAAPSPLDGSLDGAYAGTRTEDPACGAEVHRIVFQVAGGRIEVRSRHARQQLTGTVNGDGQFELQDGNGRRHIDGIIRGGRLNAAEPVGPNVGNGKYRRVSTDDPTALTCTWRYEATREGAPPSRPPPGA